MTPVYFIMRRTRLGPLLPARLWLCDYEPGEPDNKLDRPPYWRADIGGDEVDPEEVFDRTWSRTDHRPGYAASHWKYPQPITEARYRDEIKRLRWAEENRPSDPALKPRRRVDASQVSINFDRENAL